MRVTLFKLMVSIELAPLVGPHWTGVLPPLTRIRGLPCIATSPSGVQLPFDGVSNAEVES
jgi:hypothetical protein